MSQDGGCSGEFPLTAGAGVSKDLIFVVTFFGGRVEVSARAGIHKMPAPVPAGTGRPNEVHGHRLQARGKM